MKVTIWGCRGSLASPGKSTLKYGGHTTCVSVEDAEGHLVILDAGSGLRMLGKKIMQEQRPQSAHLLLTHAHWDHLCGFPFFEPAYSEDFRLSICGGAMPVGHLRQVFSQQMMAPFFPVDFSLLKAKIDFGCDCALASVCAHKLVGGASRISCSSISLNHPNGGFAFRLEEDGKAFVFMPDNELRYAHPNGLPREAYVKFCAGAELLFCDAQYTEDEYRRTIGWGHSTIGDTIQLALEAKVKRLGLFHHDPDRTDDELDHLLGEARAQVAAAGSSMDCFFCAEGMALES